MHSKINNDNKSISIDINGLNLEKSYSDSTTIFTNGGAPIRINNSYTPKLGTLGLNSSRASVGTWTTKASYGAISMSYQFDIVRKGVECSVCRARNLNYSGVFAHFQIQALKLPDPHHQKNFLPKWMEA
jgi:hypothetical protein